MAAIKLLFLLFYFYYMLKLFVRFFDSSDIVRRMAQNEGHNIFHVHSEEKSADVFRFVSPHKLINILFLSFFLSTKR